MRIAVVGSGISGLASAWTLAKEGHEVTLYEEDENRFGGHSFTYHESGEEADASSDHAPVDLGFQVFNLTTYPYLVQLLKELGVDHEPSDMSFALSIDGGRVEWASNDNGLKGLFAQRSNVHNARFLQMLRETMRFGKEGLEVLNGDKKWAEMTLGEYLDMRGYGEAFRSEYLLPMTAAVWSVPNETMLDFPVVPLVRFWENHHLMSPLGARPRWRVVKNRSETYVQAIVSYLQSCESCCVKLGWKVDSVVRDEAASTVDVTTSNGETETFDHVVLACHSNQSLAILEKDGDEEDKKLLSRIRYQPNDVYLHSDRSLMPVRTEAWASWNVLDDTNSQASHGGNSEKSERNVCVTYWLNNLQNLPADAPLRLCTLNPISPPDPSLVIDKFVLEHPIFDKAAIEAQVAINRRQAGVEGACKVRKRNVWFAGAYLGSGFHEDGLRSAVAVATGILGGRVPSWAATAGAPKHPALELIRGPSPEISWKHWVGMKLFESVASRGIKKGFLRVVLPDGNEMQFGRDSVREAELLSEPRATLWINDLSMMARCIKDSDVGLGEAYIEQLYEVDDLCEMFKVLLVNRERLGDTVTSSRFTSIIALLGTAMYKVGTYLLHLKHLAKKNTVVGSRRNIEEHYDLGNDMYELFLDDTMTYSAGIHRKEFGAKLESKEAELPLYDAQLAKLDAIIRRANIQPGDHVLEIGCGWGSFAIRAASTVGCKVTGITISTEQLKMAQERVAKLGLEDKVNLIICDYRTLGMADSAYKPGSFDAVVSIEMIEAVGHEHLPQYFETINRMLKPGGRATIQAISMRNEKYIEYCEGSDFIRRHIFPGGHLPCMDAVHWATEDTDLAIEENFDIGPDYAVTLRKWRENFVANKKKILALGYPETFFRKWIFYFVYCEAGFHNKYILNYQITFLKDAPLHAKQIKLHNSNPNRLVFQTEAEIDGSSRSSTSNDVLSSAQRKKLVSSTGSPAPLPMVSALVPAGLWGVASMITDAREMQLIATIAVLAVFVVSLLGNMFYGAYLRPPTALPNKKTKSAWVKTWIDTLFSCLVIVTVVVSFMLDGGSKSSSSKSADPNSVDPGRVNQLGLSTDNKLDSFLVVSMLLFTSFGRLAAATARTLKFREVGGYLAHSFLFSCVMLFALNSSSQPLAANALLIALLHGVGELHGVLSGCRKLLSLQGATLNNNFVFTMVCAGEALTLGLTKVAPLLVLTLYKWRFLLDVLMGNFNEVSLLIPVNSLVLALLGLQAMNARAAVATWFDLRVEYENCWKTDELVSKFARSRDELITTMASTSVSSQRSAKPAAAVASNVEKSALKEASKAAEVDVSCKGFGHSWIYHGTVMHHRFKLDGVSPASNRFKYGVWMAYVDVDEAEAGRAFKGLPFVSVNARWNVATWMRKDYYGADTGRPLGTCIRSLVKERLGLALTGPVRMVTNLRCLGYGFNPVSVYYCFDAKENLQAGVLEVSNTPWLAKRVYVIPVNIENPTYRWQKDFFVSPFMDVFHDYEWTLKKPADEINVVATSYRREMKAAEGEQWEHTTGSPPTLPSESAGEVDKKTFYVRLNLQRAQTLGGAMRCLLWQPFMTFSVLLWIHYQAAVVLWKSCELKTAPSNQQQAGVVDLMKHLFIFSVAIIWKATLAITHILATLVRKLIPSN